VAIVIIAVDVIIPVEAVTTVEAIMLLGAAETTNLYLFYLFCNIQIKSVNTAGVFRLQFIQFTKFTAAS
jgi:hypothetical protein